MKRNVVETMIGALVLGVAVAFLAFAYNRPGVETVSGYEIKARFTSVEGLKVGDDVRISGIKVGSVLAQTLDPEYYQAVVSMSIDDEVTLPDDTLAAIASEGLLGGKYIAIDPGGAEEVLVDGDEITLTQPSVNLETLLGKAIYSLSGAGEE